MSFKSRVLDHLLHYEGFCFCKVQKVKIVALWAKDRLMEWSSGGIVK